MIKTKDNGASKLVRVSGQSHNLKAGVFGDKAGKDHDGITIGEIATIHEFGTEVIPERSFIRSYVDEHVDEILEDIRKLTAKAVAKGLPLEVVMDVEGLKIVSGIQEKISDGIKPPLKEATIKRKGSSVPLIDTGQLRSSITHEVE